MSGTETPEAILASRDIIVCVGSGGVGKTTVAAALALQAARTGRRALVVTIDPARRLADAIGAVSLGNVPRAVPRDRLRALGVPEEGALFAMMLDMKRTFDDLVARFAENDDVKQRVLENPIYQHVSDALAGSGEYAAMEKVFELAEAREFDLIVLDTPPSQHALDFLEAPERLLEFLDSRLVHLLLHPALAAGRFGFRLFQRGTHRVLQLLERVSGMGFLEDVSEFLLAFEGMSEGFKQRAQRVRSLLLGPEAAFVLIAGPSPESVKHACSFLDRLEASQVPIAGLIVNRMHVWPAAGEPPERIPFVGKEEAARSALSRALAPVLDEGTSAQAAAAAALGAVSGYVSIVHRDATAAAPLIARARRGGCFARRIPERAGDIHDLGGLAWIATQIFPEAAGEMARDA